MTRGEHLAQAGLALWAVLVVAACGGGNSAAPNTTTTKPAATTTATTAPDLDALGQQYLTIIGPANQAVNEFNKKTTTYTDNTTAEEVARDAAPLADAIDKASNDLLQVDWPASIQQDIKELVKAYGALSGDLRSVGNQTIFSIANWTTQFAQDGGRARAAANIVRADLGLPPVKTG
jgi:hypothetical protein